MCIKIDRYRKAFKHKMSVLYQIVVIIIHVSALLAVYDDMNRILCHIIIKLYY